MTKPIVQSHFVKSAFISYHINGRRDSASGFFYKSGQNYYLITNKHVVEEKDYGDIETVSDFEDPEIHHPSKFYAYIRTDPANAKKALRERINLFDSNGNSLWKTHSNPDVDIVAIPLEIDIRYTHNQAYSKSEFLPSDVVLLGGDSIMAIGYPEGLYDANTYFPVIRNGMIATPPAIDYKEQPAFLMDAQMHPGTSGSPAVSQPSFLQRHEDGLSLMDNTVSYLLGIHSGPEYAPEPYEESDKSIDRTEQDRALGLHYVWRVELIEEILQ